MQIRRRTVSICLAFILVSTYCFSQDMTEDEILRIYQKQLGAGLSTRGASPAEIKEYLKMGSDGVSSIQQFTKAINDLYTQEFLSRTAILFFFQNNDTLYRYFITEGGIKEQKKITITKTALQSLNDNIFSSLKLYSLSKDRSPRLRGTVPVSTSESSPPSLEQCISAAQKVLLPSGLDTSIKHLIIIPCYSIGAFPFHLLKPYADGKYLIDRCSFSVAPSLFDLVAIRKRLIKRRPELLNDYYDKNKVFTLEHPLFVCDPEFPVNTIYDFPPLPGTRKEIQAALVYAKRPVLLEGKNATRQKVMDSIRNCDLAYFATHGMASETEPMDKSFLVLSGERDPFLTSRNIFSLRDSLFRGDFSFPEMVILSACQSGLGRAMEAGIFGGMARSFMIAGANCVIMSLWNVDDEATAFLMSRFIYHMQQPTLFLPSEPMRLAILDTREKFPSPIYWAGFSVYGVDY